MAAWQRWEFQVMVWWILQSGYRLKCLTCSRRDSWHGISWNPEGIHQGGLGGRVPRRMSGSADEVLHALSRHV